MEFLFNKNFVDNNSIISIGIISAKGHFNYYNTVNPGYKKIRVSKYCRKLTGLTKEKLKESPLFPKLFNQLNKKIPSDSIIYTWGNADIENWNNVCNRYNLDNNFCFKNYQKLIKKKFNLNNDPSLFKTAKYLNISTKNRKHHALYDALVFRKIYLKVSKKPKLCKLILRRLEYEVLLNKLNKKYTDVLNIKLSKFKNV